MELNIYTDTDYEDELWQIEGIHDVYCVAYDKPDHDTIRKVEARIGQKLFREIQEYYSRNNGFTFYWHTRRSGIPTITGSCQIATLSSYLTGNPYIEHTANTPKYENLLWDDSDDHSTIDYIENNYFIIDYVDIRANVFVCFDASETEGMRLFLYKYPHRRYDLSLDFNEYIQWAVKLRGLQGWQDLFIKDKTTICNTERPYPFHYFFKTCFPNETLDIPSTISANECSFIRATAHNNYLHKFESSVEKLSKVKSIENLEFDIGITPLSLHVIRKVETIIGRLLPDAILAFYLQMNGIELKWRSSERINKYQPRANFKLLALDEMFGGFEPTKFRNWEPSRFEGILTFPDTMEPEQLNLANNFRLFNSEEFNDIGLAFEEEMTTLYVFDKGNFFHLNISFSEYIEKLMENRGIEFWQLFFTNNSEYPDAYLNVCPPIKKAIQKYFPEVDLQTYRSPN